MIFTVIDTPVHQQQGEGKKKSLVHIVCTCAKNHLNFPGIRILSVHVRVQQLMDGHVT